MGGAFQIGCITLGRALREGDTIQNIAPDKEKMTLVLLLILPSVF